jgi:hypothetical protein
VSRTAGSGGGHGEGSEVRLLQVAFLYYRYTRAGWSGDDVRRGVAATFGDEWESAVAALEDRSDQVFDSIWPMPNCGDCSGCAVRGSCYYPSWKSVAARLDARMRESFPRQSDLARLFEPWAASGRGACPLSTHQG